MHDTIPNGRPIYGQYICTEDNERLESIRPSWMILSKPQEGSETFDTPRLHIRTAREKIQNAVVVVVVVTQEC